MIKVERKLNPSFMKYDEKNVKDALKIDFSKKCYLCEEVTRHWEVEHFYPQKYYLHLINDYANLFYVCQKCNKIKPKNINTKCDDEILNCCEIDVEAYIKLKLNTKECKVEIIKLQSYKNLDKRVDNTMSLLDRIYNGTNSQSDSCEDLRDEIKDIIISFRKKLNSYNTSKLKQAISKEIIEDLDSKSSYSTFKRWIIKDNLKLYSKFKQHIGD